MTTQDGYRESAKKHAEQVKKYNEEQREYDFFNMRALLSKHNHAKRKSWNKSYITHIPMRTSFSSATNKMTKYLSYIEFTYENGDKIPWESTETDYASKDWIFI